MASEGRTLSFPEERFRVIRFPDRSIEALGHPATGEWTEKHWLPVLGPASTALLRNLNRRLGDSPEGFTVDTSVLAVELGLGVRGGRHGPMWRSVERLQRFGMVKRNGETLAVRSHVPPLTVRQAERLPVSLQRSAQMVAAAPDAAKLVRSRSAPAVRPRPGGQPGRPQLKPR